MKKRAEPKVVFEESLWQTIADAIRFKLDERHHDLVAIAVGAVHVHVLANLPDDPAAYKHEIGVAKRFTTEQVKDCLTGQLWAQGGTFKPIRDRAHPVNVFHYITAKQKPAWVWDRKIGGRLVE